MFKNVAWNTIGTIFYCFCQWLITIIVVRVASFEAAGYLSLAMTTSSTFSTITLFSMRNFQISDVTEEYSTDEYVTSRVLTCAVSMILCMAAAFAGNSGYQALCVISFMILRVAEGMVDVLHGIDQKHDRYDLIGVSFFIRGIITIATFSLVLILTKNLLWTLMVMAACNLAAALLWDWRRTNSLEKLRITALDSGIKRLLMTCLPLVAFTFLLSMENLFPKMMLKNMLGTDQLGIYSSIASPTLIVQVFASVAFNPFLPGLSKLYVEKEYESFLKGLRKLYLALAGLTVITCIGAMLIGRWGLDLLFGADILKYYNLFMPIVWCTILTAFIWILYAIVVALRKIWLLVAGMGIDFLILLVITKPCITTFEKNGASVAQIVAYALFTAFLIAVCEITVRISRIRNKKAVSA